MNILDQPKLIGVAHLNEKGQIVIPKEAREYLGIGPGERVIILAAPLLKAIVIARPEDVEVQLRQMMSNTQSTIDNLYTEQQTGTE